MRGEIKNTFGRYRLASSLCDHFSLSLHFNIHLREGRSEDKAVQRERTSGRSEGKNNMCMVEYGLCSVFSQSVVVGKPPLTVTQTSMDLAMAGQ